MATGISFLLFLSIAYINLGVTFSKSQLIRLDENNWQNMLSGEWMVEFYAPWCPACKALQPLWEEFSTWNKDLGLSVAQVDVTSSPGLSGRFMVTALPTIFHVVNGEFRQYKGARDRESLMSFVEDQKWKEVEPVPGWKSPSSIQMSVVAYFFKLSQGLRTIHNKMMEDYGLPNWGSYLIFAVVTIVLGAILGLIMVCFIDFIYPPKVIHRTLVTADEKSDEENEDLPDEEDADDERSPEANNEEDADDERSPESNNIRKRGKARKAD